MYLVINLGLKSIRIIVFDDEAKVIYSDSLPIQTFLKKNRVEQDVNEWKDLLFKLLNVLNLKTDLIGKIKYITSTASSSCVFAYDRDMQPITNVLMVSDRRAFKEVSSIKSNSVFIERNKETTINCSVSSNIPKLLWFKNNEPNIFKKIKYWIGANEFLNYMLTGELFTDSLNASKSFYSDITNKYHEDILSDLSMSSKMFPKVHPIGSSYKLNNSIIENFSFSKECRYVLTSYDAICAVIGSHTGLDGDVCDVSGTVTSVRVLSSKNIKLRNKSSVILQQEIPLINKTIIGSSNNLGGGIIEWYKQTFFKSNLEKTYFQMINESMLSPPGANGLLFLPFLLGERAPFVNENIRGSFFGINRDSSRNDFTRAVFESTAFVTMDLLSLIRNEGILTTSLCVGGGLARIDEINQIKADVTNLPVKVLKNFESTSLGALILIKLSLSHFGSLNEAAAKLVPIKKIIYPNKSNVQIYLEIYKFYKKMTDFTIDISSFHSEITNKLNKYSNSILRNL